MMNQLRVGGKRNGIYQASLSVAASVLLVMGTAHANSSANEGQQPEEIVQAFLNTMDYQLLSADDREVWSEQRWQQIQQRAAQANQVRLPAEHEFHLLEQKIRVHVSVTVVSSEAADDGSYKVTTEFEYPYILMLIDDYIDTRSSYAYEQLQDYNRSFADNTLELNGEDIFRSRMPWRVRNGGVFVNAAQLQENRDALQAQGGY